MGWFFGSKKKDEKNDDTGVSPVESVEPVEEKPEETTGPSLRSEKRPEIILKNILVLMGIEDSISKEEANNEIHLNISGEYGALLIGKRGQTLDALEFLLNKICFGGQKNPGTRIFLDAENYRKKREERIIFLARNLASKVADLGEPDFIHPMSPMERKIVHITLRDHPSVETKSEGEGFYKKVVLYPKKY